MAAGDGVEQFAGILLHSQADTRGAEVQTISATHQVSTSWRSEYLVSTEARNMSSAFDGGAAPRWNGRNTTSPRLTDMPLSAQTPLRRA